MCCLYAHFKKRQGLYLSLIAIILTLTMAFLLCYFVPYCNEEIIKGFFILVSAIATSFLAIHKYKSEQRASQIQKLYFEDTLLGIAKSMEEMMSQTTINMLLAENLLSVLESLLKQKELDFLIIKNNIFEAFDDAFSRIKLGVKTEDFKKETISKLLYDSYDKANMLPTWVKKFEEDSNRFAYFLRSQILILKTLANKLNENNTESFKSILSVTLNHIQNNYTLIERHYILFSLYSEIVLDFSSENYSSVDDIIDAFKSERIIKINILIDETYKDVISDFASVNIGDEITPAVEARLKDLKEKIEYCKGKIMKVLYRN